MKKHWGLDFVTLELIVAAAETGSISRAAVMNHLAMAAASRRISEFEERAGVRIFERQPRGVRLTAAGQSTLSSIRRLIADANSLARAVENVHRGVTDRLRVLATNAAITTVLPDVVARYSSAYPLVHIDVEQLTSPDIVRAIVERRASLGAVWAAMDTQGLQSMPCGHDELALVVPQHHPLSRRRSVAFEETLDFDYVLFESSSPIYSLLGVEASRCNRALKGKVSVMGFYAVSRLVEAGLGIGVMPRMVAMQIAGTMRIVVIRFKDAWARMDFSLVYREANELGAVERAFVGMVAGGQS